jgi:RNA polymerase sigma-70 factor (ECF subfamily)
MTPSTAVKVSRAVAVAMARGNDAGLDLLLDLEDEAEDYFPYHAARADLLRRAGEREAAAEAYARAAALCGNGPEREYLEGRRGEMLWG